MCRDYKRVALSNLYDKGIDMFVHRLVALAFLPNPENKACIDHIDNNRGNNNIENLRWATHQENNRNTPLNCKNTSTIKGVSFRKDTLKWTAYITIDDIKINLGCFENIEDAKDARIVKANAVFGMFVNACEKLD
jgi:hypothetical protein